MSIPVPEYPTPLVNMFREEPMFTRMAVQSSVLKVMALRPKLPILIVHQTRC
jgi:hypothetical protein